MNFVTICTIIALILFIIAYLIPGDGPDERNSKNRY